MTFLEYNTKFERLSWYAPQLIDTVEKKINKFLDGLNLIIKRDATKVVTPASFDEAVRRAYKFENINHKVIQDSQRKHQHQQNQKFQNNKKLRQDHNQGDRLLMLIVGRNMKPTSVAEPWELVIDVGLWIMWSKIAHKF